MKRKFGLGVANLVMFVILFALIRLIICGIEILTSLVRSHL